jgi:phage-related protein
LKSRTKYGYMPIDALGSLLSAASSKVNAGLGIVKAIACLPAIITGAVGIFKDVFGAIKNAAMGAIQGAVGAIAGMVEGYVKGIIDQVVGAISGVLGIIMQLIATVMAAINMVVDFFKNLIEAANAALAWSQNAENCRFAAAALLKCIIASAVSEMTSDLKLTKNISAGLEPISTAVNKITDKISKPGGIITGYLNKAEAQVNRATATIEATNLI